MRIKRIRNKHPQTKKDGYTSRVVTNCTLTLSEMAEMAGDGYTWSAGEITGILTDFIDHMMRQLQRGYIIDLCKFGSFRPVASSPWTETPEEQQKRNITIRIEYKPKRKFTVPTEKLEWDDEFVK